MQEVPDLVCLAWTGEQESLGEIAPDPPQVVELSLRFDALSDDTQVQGVREIDDRPHDARRRAVELAR